MVPLNIWSATLAGSSLLTNIRSVCLRTASTPESVRPASVKHVRTSHPNIIPRACIRYTSSPILCGQLASLPRKFLLRILSSRAHHRQTRPLFKLMPQDSRFHHISTIDAAPGIQPAVPTVVLHVDKMVRHHQSLTSLTRHRATSQL